MKDTKVDYKKTEYWERVEEFLNELPTIPWLIPQIEPGPGWWLFDSQSMARNEAYRLMKDPSSRESWNSKWFEIEEKVYDVAEDGSRKEALEAAAYAAWHVLWNEIREIIRERLPGESPDTVDDVLGCIAGDVLLMAEALACGGLPLPQEYIDHLESRMNVWRNGFTLVCDLNGEFLVYADLTRS